MRTDDEVVEWTWPDWPWPRAVNIRDIAAKLRRRGFGPAGARYMAIYLVLDDALGMLFAAEDAVAKNNLDGVQEAHCMRLLRPAIAEVQSVMVRHVAIEARHAIAGKRMQPPQTVAWHRERPRPEKDGVDTPPT